jgi:arylsulfatase
VRAALALAFGAAACGPAPAPPPNLLFVLVDTLRADRLPLYGHPGPTAPRLAELAARGVLFERVIAPSSWTKTSMASILTGRAPDRHGVLGVSDVLPGDLVTLAEAFSAAGYRTLAVNSNPWLAERFGFAAGFDVFETHLFARGAKVNQRALDLIAAAREPWLLYVHYMDVHSPYRPDPRFFDEPPLELPGLGRLSDAELEERYRKRGLDGPRVRERVLRLYDAGIRSADAALGELLDALEARGRMANTIAVVTADHGEAFGEHGTTEHGKNLYPEVCEVPLVLVFEGRLPAGARRPGQVSSIDVAPTLLELAGLPAEPGFEGRSLLPLDLERPEARVGLAGLARAENDGDFDLVAVVSPDHLYLRERRRDRVEFYDLRADPGALRDLGPAHPAVPAYAALEGAGGAPPPPRTELDAETLEALRALGYLEAEE